MEQQQDRQTPLILHLQASILFPMRTDDHHQEAADHREITKMAAEMTIADHHASGHRSHPTAVAVAEAVAEAVVEAVVEAVALEDPEAVDQEDQAILGPDMPTRQQTPKATPKRPTS